MTLAQIQDIKQTLLNKEAELLAGLRNREGLIIEPSADVLESIQSAGARQAAADTLTRDSALLALVRAAMERQDEGEYGWCTTCQDDIHPARLKAVPWAALCLKCQDKADRRSR